MPVVTIDPARCDRRPGCPARRVCPRGAITPVAGGAPNGSDGYTVETEKCTGCGACIRVCPMSAIRFV